MASIGVIQTTVSAEVSSTSTSFTEVTESEALVSGKTYYVICHGLIEGSSNSSVFQWRLVDRTNSDAVISNSTQIREVTQNNITQSYYYVGRFTAGSGGGGLAFEQKSSFLQTVRTQYLSMVLLDIDNLASGDYFYSNDTTTTALTNSFQDFAEKEKGLITASDNWLVFGWQATQIDEIANNTEIKLNCSDGTTDVPLVSFEGEDLTEQLNCWICRGYTIATGGSVTWKIQSRCDGSPATNNNHLESTVFGLRLSAFENTNFSYGASNLTTATTFQNLHTKAFTPDSTGDVIAVGFSAFDADSTNRKSLQRVQVDGTTSPNTQPDTEYACNSNDFSDVLPLGYVTKYAGVADTAKTITLDAKKESSANYGWLTYTFAQFTAKIKDTALNYSAVAVGTYNSGDVASQTFALGNVASQTFASGDVASEIKPT